MSTPNPQTPRKACLTIERMDGSREVLATRAAVQARAEVADAVRLLRLLTDPCPCDHDWTECPRCLTIEELSVPGARASHLLRVVADMLEAQR